MTEPRRWLMWAHRSATDFTGFGTTRDAARGWRKNGALVPVRVFEDPAGDYIADVMTRYDGDRHGDLDFVIPYTPGRDETESVRIRVEPLTLPNGADDTSSCPPGDVCEVCGAAHDELTVNTMASPTGGVACFTSCIACGDAGKVPAINGWSHWFDYVANHCGHLGVDLDEMGALIELETDR